MSLQGANLRGANLSGAHLSSVDLTDARLTGADLRKVTAHESTFINADLSYADLYQGPGLARGRNSAERISLKRRWFSQTYLKRISLGAESLESPHGASNLAAPSSQTSLLLGRTNATVTVDNLEVAQFIYLLLNNERIRHAIDTITSKGRPDSGAVHG